jgi:ADP-heptose:LPS heptosyltransferase
MLSEKHFKIWGVSYGVVGDLIMGLPVLQYYENKYPQSYKIWAIEKKVGFMAPFFLNHPLIDRIKITDEWSGFGNDDRFLAQECDIRCTMDNWKHDQVDWYNYRDCIEETARIAGVYDLDKYTTKEERIPKLYQWFDAGEDSKTFQTYSKENDALLSYKSGNDNIISIFPFATATSNIARSPSVKWWEQLIDSIRALGYKVYQFGYGNDPQLYGTYRFMEKAFFDQVKIALSTKMSIGTDSGNMWVMGAYSHPAVHLMTNWMQHHNRNFDALLPVNKNGFKVFAPGGANNISREHVLAYVQTIMEAKI